MIRDLSESLSRISSPSYSTGCHTGRSSASCCRTALSLGRCSVSSALSCQMFTVPSAFPTARSCCWLNSTHRAHWPPASCSIVATGRRLFKPKSNTCNTPEIPTINISKVEHDHSTTCIPYLQKTWSQFYWNNRFFLKNRSNYIFDSAIRAI